MATYVAKKTDDLVAEPKIHRIRITLTSRNVKNLEKGFFINLISTHTDSLWRFDHPCKGQATQGQGTRAIAHKGPSHHHSQNAQW